MNSLVPETLIVATTPLKNRVTGSIRAHARFALLVILSVLFFWKTIHALVVFSLNEESSSHILLIPLVSIYLLYTERSRIFRVVRSSPFAGNAVMLAAVAIYSFAALWLSSRVPGEYLTVATLSIVALWLGGFLLCYGGEAWRRASFSLLFLLLMIPLPPPVLERSITLLQQGSTDIAYLLFKAVGVPVLRQGFILSLPRVTIEVAKECSGIRSSVALFITCLLAAHLFLRTKWRMLIFVLLAFPLAIVKNGIRITTLTLLSVYVNPAFLTGRLHRQGGFVFFFLALAILAPVLIILQKSEDKEPVQDTGIVRKPESGLAAG
jgi:exosortase